MKRLEDSIVDKIVLSIHLINPSISIAVAYNDGSVEFRDRNSLDVIAPDGDWNRVTSLSRAGLAFLAEEPCMVDLDPLPIDYSIY